MHTRRGFLGSLALGTAALLTTSRSLLASGEKKIVRTQSQLRTVVAGLVFSARYQGMYKGKDKSHAPQITVDGQQVTLRTMHGMTREHYIVRHTLLDASGRQLGASTFTPDDKPYSSYRLPRGYKGTITASSFCNRHDLWISQTTVG